MRRILACLLVVLFVLGACVVDPDNDNQDGAGSDCKSEADCAKGQICPAGGAFKGKCSISCEKDDDCTLRVGDGQYCWKGVCTAVCADTCNFGLKTSTCTGKLRCVPQQELDGTQSSCTVGWCVP